MNAEEWFYDRLWRAVQDLTQPRRTVEAVSYWDKARHRKWRTHVVDHPPLLIALERAVVPGHGASGEHGVRRVPGSRPPLRLDAIDAQATIYGAVRVWVKRVDATSRGGVGADLALLAGLALTLPLVRLERLSKDAQGWVSLTRVLIGEESPSTALYAPCLTCDAIGGLRVRWQSQTAGCVKCGAGWRADDGSLTLLAEHVRTFADGRSVSGM